MSAAQSCRLASFVRRDGSLAGASAATLRACSYRQRKRTGRRARFSLTAPGDPFIDDDRPGRRFAMAGTLHSRP